MYDVSFTIRLHTERQVLSIFKALKGIWIFGSPEQQVHRLSVLSDSTAQDSFS